MRFSIVTVALNPGDKLQKTLDSVFCQTCTDYEIILKDGGSTDGSMDKWRNAEQKADMSREQGVSVFLTYRTKESMMP